YACRTHNMGLAKLCYRRGAPLEGKTESGDTPFNIATKQRDYMMMEFLYTYGVRINSKDALGKAALHVAASSNDVDAICRLIEWGADVNLRDNRQRTPLHYAAAGGHIKGTMLLLELGADLNAEDHKEYTAVAHAEANDHFLLMDRLASLGGRGHRLHEIRGQVPAPPKRKSTREQLMENEAMGIVTNPKRKNSIISPLYDPAVKKEINKYAALQARDDLEAKQLAKLAAKKLVGTWGH
ncbi:ankyrin repeat, SAM and basic leucine zipper domain-containing protein, putative, partial [Perkinsus marinus ATCC 50983]